jgi:threonine/homoserine/homoserine lactone efflux protein
MAVQLWLAFVGASAVMVAIPGPTVTMVVGYALSEGRSAALAVAFGVAAGDLTAMTLSLLGMGAILAASAALFTAVKLVGAAYLVYLGWRLWTSPVTLPAAQDGDATGVGPVKPRSPRAMFGHAFAVTAMNPKSLIFFVAFVPQFVDRKAAYGPQVAVLVATFVSLGLLNALVYAYAASGARLFLRRPAVLRAINRVGGGILMGAGAAAVAVRNGQ